MNCLGERLSDGNFGGCSFQCTIAIPQFKDDPTLRDIDNNRLCDRCKHPVSSHPAEMSSSQQGGQSQADEPMMRFRTLLGKFKGPDPVVLNTIVKYSDLSSRLAVVSTEEQALELYKDAMLFPRSSTRLFLRDTDFVLDGPLHGAVSSKAIFIKAFDNGVPVAVKVFDANPMVQDELSMIQQLEIPPSVPFSVGLVPVKQWTPPQSQSLKRPSSMRALIGMATKELPKPIYPTNKILMVMPNFPTTASEFPLPVPPRHVLSYGKDVLTGLQRCWDRGFGFCDCKPSNIFISCEGRAYIGDYGGLTKLGEPYRETTPKYIPTNYGSDIASADLDRWMLVVSLLELTNSSQFNSSLTMSTVVHNVEALLDEELQEFLKNLIPS